MVYGHKVKFKGVWYNAGQEVPMGATENVAPEKTIVDVKYTKTDINRMSSSELKALAKQKNVKGYENMNGTELKAHFIKLFNL